MIYEKDTRTGATHKPITYELQDECWNCTSHAVNVDGYPTMKVGKKHWRISRYVFLMEYDYLDDDLVVMHSCDNPLCINPDHLHLGTTQDNIRDKVSKGRHLKGSDVPASKLTETEVQSILNDTRSQRAIAKAYGVHYMTIWRIKNRKGWSHL